MTGSNYPETLAAKFKGVPITEFAGKLKEVTEQEVAAGRIKMSPDEEQAGRDFFARVYANGPLDFKHMRDVIHEAHAKATTEEERVTSLAMHMIIKQNLENSQIGPPDVKADLLKAWRQDYVCLLASECMVLADGSFCADRYREVVRREVMLGRIAADDELYTVTLAPSAPPSPAPKPGFLARLFRR